MLFAPVTPVMKLLPSEPKKAFVPARSGLS